MKTSKAAEFPTFLRIQAVVRETGLSRSTIYALIKDAEAAFPRPYKMTGPSGRAVAWKGVEVEAWLAARQVAAYALA